MIENCSTPDLWKTENKDEAIKFAKEESLIHTSEPYFVIFDSNENIYYIEKDACPFIRVSFEKIIVKFQEGREYV